MKKQNKFSSLSISELFDKQKNFLKQFVNFKVSLDPSVITESGGIDGLRRDLKSIQRQIISMSSGKQEAELPKTASDKAP
jgi:hypothetical protein